MALVYFRNPQGAKSFRITTEEVLYVVEGLAEAYFLENLFLHLAFDPLKTGVLCARGQGLQALNGVLKPLYTSAGWSALKGLGIFYDAESSYKKTRKMIRDALRGVPNLGPRFKLNPESIQTVGSFKTATFISPGSKKNGRIEDLVLIELGGHPDYPCIVQLDKCMEAGGDAKALVSCYLTCKLGSVSGTNRGFEKDVLKVNDPAYAAVVKLFSVPLC